MAKLTLEVLSTVKGLDKNKPTAFTHPGTVDKPTLIEMEDNAATQALIDTKVVRVWPGPVAPTVPASEKAKKLQEEIAAQQGQISQLQSDLAAYREQVATLVTDLQTIVDLPDLEAAKTVARDAIAAVTGAGQ